MINFQVGNFDFTEKKTSTRFFLLDNPIGPTSGRKGFIRSELKRSSLLFFLFAVIQGNIYSANR